MQGFTYKYGDRPLEGYTIQRAAGRGGFGEVYYALSDSGREVALKVVQGYESIELRGISQCMNLKSPHLVTIFDVKYNEAGRPFVIMEYVNGPSLRELLDESPAGLGTQKAAFFLREMAKGLTYLHDRGIVHRDLKPGNVFYEDGYVKIGDYGLSKAISASRHSGQTITVGTVHYMAPEIGQGNYDRSIDIYALGCMLYEMLTGQTPYLGASPGEILMKHMMEAPDLAGVEEPFATVTRKALAKEPKDRFQTVQEMVEAVFGAAHIQQSVSCFSPDSLTMVAGRVARKVGVGGPGSSGQNMDPGGAGVPGDPQAEWIDRLGNRMEQVEQKIEAAGDRFGQKVQQTAERIRNKWQGNRAAPPPLPLAAPAEPPAVRVDPKRDPLNRSQRRWLGLGAGVIVCLGAGYITAETGWGGSSPDGALIAPLGPFLGVVIGMLLAHRRLGANLEGESWLVRHVAYGGIAGIVMLGASVATLAWLDEMRMQPISGRYGPGTLAAIALPLFVLDWGRIMHPARSQRIGLGHALLAGGIALASAFVLNGCMPLAMGAVCAASLAIQAMCAFDPKAARLARGRSTKAQADLEFDFGRKGTVQPQLPPQASRMEPGSLKPRPRVGPVHLPPPGAGVWTAQGYRVLPPGVSPAKRVWALLLASGVFMAMGGLHRFYVGKIWTGLLWFFTWGLFGLGQLIDAILVISGNFKDKQGRRLVVWADYDEVRSVWAYPPPAPGGQRPVSQEPPARSPVPQVEAVRPAAGQRPREDDSAAGWQRTSAWTQASQASTRQNPTNPLLAFLGGVLLLVTVMLGVAGALAVPAITAFGAFDPDITQDEWFRQLVDGNWARIIEPIHIVLTTMVGLLAAIVLILARRWAGGAHMFRAVAGTAGLLLSLYVFRMAVTPEVHSWRLAVYEMGQGRVEQMLRELLNGMQPGGLIMAGLLLLGSIIVLAWTPRRTDDELSAAGRGG